MVLALVIAQAMSAIALGSISFFPALVKPVGGLSPLGRVAFGMAAATFLVATGVIQVLNTREARVGQDRIDELMRRIADTAMTPSTASPSPVPAPTGQALRIFQPPDTEAVEATAEVRGRSSSPGQVWVVVHPLGTSSYWVQPRVSVQRSGDWRVTGYFGRSGSIDAGKVFEVLAIVDPATELGEGEILDGWPPARLVSDVVTVRRK